MCGVTGILGYHSCALSINRHELFKQLPRWQKINKPLNNVPGIRRAGSKILRKMASWNWAPSKLTGLARYGGSFSGLYMVRRGLFMPWELPTLLGYDLAEAGLQALQPPSFIDNTLGSEPNISYATVASLDSQFYLRNQLLRDSDWASMAHSLELRTPLVDIKVLRALAPFLVQRTFQAHPKITLAQAPGTPLPEKVVNRSKTGFSLPMARWLSDTQVLDNWRNLSYFTHKNCHWSRRMAYSLIADLIK